VVFTERSVGKIDPRLQPNWAKHTRRSRLPKEIDPSAANWA